LYASTKHRFSVHTLLFGLDFDDFHALIVTTPGTNLVGQAQFVTIGAWHEIPGLQRMMAAPLPLAGLAQFSFW
jgi:hypothetical protein